MREGFIHFCWKCQTDRWFKFYSHVSKRVERYICEECLTSYDVSV